MESHGTRKKISIRQNLTGSIKTYYFCYYKLSLFCCFINYYVIKFQMHFLFYLLAVVNLCCLLIPGVDCLIVNDKAS